MGTDKGSIPALVPPDRQSVLKSISIFESVDILCEGPIYGLVDQFGKKVYGLDMLKGVYLNKIPVMNSKGEYNFRNVLMEINLGTENQKPLVNFKNVNIFKPSNFKLMGPIKGPSSRIDGEDIRPDPNKWGATRDFVSWARNGGGWPSVPQDPYIFIHHIKNKDVKKVKIGLIIENLFDTVDQGPEKGKAGTMGMSKSTRMDFILRYGLENTRYMVTRGVSIFGTVNSPYATMIGQKRQIPNQSDFKFRTTTNPPDLPNTQVSNSRNVTSDFSEAALNSLREVTGDSQVINISSLLFYFDPGNTDCYKGSGNECFDLVSKSKGVISGARYFGPNRPNFSFDGTDDSIRFDSAIFNKPYSGKTIVITARLATHMTNNSFKPLWSTNGSRNFGTWLQRNSSGQYSIHFSTGASGSIQSANSAILPIVVGNWFSIVVTHSRSEPANVVNFYFNGNAYGTGSFAFSQFAENTYEYIGFWGTEYWNGNVGNVLIANECFTTTQVSQVSNVMKRKFGII